MRGKGLTTAEKVELWRRWRQGESLSAIGRALGRSEPCIGTVVRQNGGLTPTQRVRSKRHLSLEERESISRGLAQGLTLRGIAGQLGRAPSTITREIARNSGIKRYRAAAADKRAWNKGLRPKACHLTKYKRLRDIVAAKLREDWSPQQIAGYLKCVGSARVQRSGDYVSHETIYKCLYLRARNALKQELCSHLRRGRSVRRGRRSSVRGQSRGRIAAAVSIHQRPRDIELRTMAGHWEEDLVAGTKRSHIATLVERHSRSVMLVQLRGRDTRNVTDALLRETRKLPSNLLKSLTWDRGLEMALHAEFTAATGADVYFCDPRAPWQRGTNENTNGLLRQYLPKGKDLSKVTQEELDAIARRLNTRPRKSLDWLTPSERLSRAVAMTV